MVVEAKYIYLTLIAEEAISAVFTNKTYKDFLECMRQVAIEDSTLKKLISDYLEILEAFYSGLEVADNKLLLQFLGEDIEHEKIFIRYKSIMESIEYPEGYEVECSRVNAKGRVSYIAQIYKNTWVNESMVDVDGWTLKPNNYDIHIEASFDMFNKKFTLPLHYETYPYKSKKWLSENIEHTQYSAYKAYRETKKQKLAERLNKEHLKEYSLYNGSNQILKAKVSIDDITTVYDFKQQVKEKVEVLGMLVDSMLEGN